MRVRSIIQTYTHLPLIFLALSFSYTATCGAIGFEELINSAEPYQEEGESYQESEPYRGENESYREQSQPYDSSVANDSAVADDASNFPVVDHSPNQSDVLKQLLMKSQSRDAAYSLNNENDTVAFLKVKIPASDTVKSIGGAVDYVAAAKQFLSGNQKALNLNNTDEELRTSEVSIDDYQGRHVKFQQVHQGIPVWGREAVVHLDQSATVYYFNGRYRPSLVSEKGLDQRPSISEEEAKRQIYNDLGTNTLNVLKSELMIYDQDAPARLVYYFDVVSGADQHWLYFIDAHTAQVVHRIDQIFTNLEMVQAEGKDIKNQRRLFKAVNEASRYYMFDPREPDAINANEKGFSEPWGYNPVISGVPGVSDVMSFTSKAASQSSFTMVLDAKYGNGNPAIASSNSQSANWDKAAVSAMYSALKTQQYYWEKFKRKGIDGKGMPAISVVHYEKGLNNALWNGKVMIYGDGDGKRYSHLAGCLDVGAHEMTHGVIENTAGLIYQKQSGALNESFADVFAAMVDRDDWLLGEDCTVAKPGYLRSIENPANGLSSQPKTMKDYQHLPLTTDNGGVHINSGIPNYAAYLTAKAIGRDKTEQIYFRALSYYLLKNSQFIDARRALIQSAEDIYGANTAETKAVETAWNTVEVFEPKSKPTPSKPAPAKPKPDTADPAKTFESDLLNILNQ